VAQEGYKHFNIYHAKCIKEFMNSIMSVYKKDEYTVYIHCLMGQSRSAGCAAAFHYIYNHDDSIIFNDKRYKPNVLIYRTLLEVYGYSWKHLLSERFSKTICMRNRHYNDIVSYLNILQTTLIEEYFPLTFIFEETGDECIIQSLDELRNMIRFLSCLI